MKSMDKISTGIAYGTSAGSAGLLVFAVVGSGQAITVGCDWCAGKSASGASDLSDESVFQNKRRQA